jgi:hypothetical protein
MSLPERRDEIAVEVAPRRLAMQADDHLSVALVDIVHPKSRSIAEVRRKWEGAVEGFVSWDHRCGSIVKPFKKFSSPCRNRLQVDIHRDR